MKRNNEKGSTFEFEVSEKPTEIEMANGITITE